jgi:hypothetical protein
MKNLLAITCLLFSITSCKTESNCDAYSQNLNMQIDSLKLEINSKQDSIRIQNDYIIFLENDNHILGSALAEKELTD